MTHTQLPATITVNSPNPYTVVVGENLTDQIVEKILGRDGCTTVAIVYQEAVADLCETLQGACKNAGLNVVMLPIADAEAGKTLNTCSDCWNQLGEAGFGRRDLVVGVGGGAATDLAGFVAAAWMRGVDYISVPTTLLAMVDAAVGGKTGINTGAGKNLVGAFHEPVGVFCDLTQLSSLPKSEIVAGSAEIIKAGFIVDPKILDHYENTPEQCVVPGDVLADLIVRAIQVKADVVGQDFKESNLRMILNYGHTLGHAVERRENYTWRHGSAVAVGMVFAAILAEHTGRLTQADVQRHVAILKAIGLPTTYEADAFDELFETMLLDKKNRGGQVRFVLLEGIHHPAVVDGIDRAACEKAYQAMIALGQE